MKTGPHTQIVKTTRFGKRQVLYDATLVAEPDEALFAPDAAALIDTGSINFGRAQVKVHHYLGMDVVSKHYYRGGMMAALLGDIYLGMRAENSRSFREWCMLSTMRNLELPVPVPVAASVTSSGMFYRADLVTMLMHGVETLADRCGRESADAQLWEQVGRTIRRFHDSNVYHADLNARNILIHENGEISLIDFDKGGFRLSGSSWRPANLARLKRSLDKFKGNTPGFNFEATDWSRLLAAYGA